jgi:non-lysosomal glucosylceramidase
MDKTNEIPKYAWSRRLNDKIKRSGRPKNIKIGEAVKYIPAFMRLQSHFRKEKKVGRSPELAIDFNNRPNPGAVMGVPLGGIGGGSITRGWQGDFNRWQIRPGYYHYGTVSADQFSIYVKHQLKDSVSYVLNPNKPSDGSLSKWKWDLNPKYATYYALYPRAWTVYEDPALGVKLTCRQISPIIPHNYKESSYPVGVFVWTIENTQDVPAKVGLMFTFQNGTGSHNDVDGGHLNKMFMETEEEGKQVTGIKLKHKYRQIKRREEGDPSKPIVYEDPLSFSIATDNRNGAKVTYKTKFTTNSKAGDLWTDFQTDGKLDNYEYDELSKKGEAIGGALCSTIKLKAGETKEIVFALSWDMPIARFGCGRSWYRRYTRFFGYEANISDDIAKLGLKDYLRWERDIEKWQKPILDNPELPDWYKGMLFNETYFISDGGTIWTNGQPDEEKNNNDDFVLPEDKEYGHFSYLEGHEYTMYNTYDVHFYASFALIMNWPKLELTLQRDFINSVFAEDNTPYWMFNNGKKVARKQKGAVPHDLGSPREDPWSKINVYNIHDTNRWKDLNSKFVLQIYRDFLETRDRDFLKDSWDAVVLALDYLKQFDKDNDGMIENENFPDQTYDVWNSKGISAYTGGLWIASLLAGEQIAKDLRYREKEDEYRELYKKAKVVYERELWNGKYYKFDNSNKNKSIVMADQLAGQWYSSACRLPRFIPEDNIRSALETIYRLNLKNFHDGNLGTINAMFPNGKPDKSNIQSAEVWTGTTFSIAATMLQVGMTKEAFETAKGIYTCSYELRGYWFQTPEAWNTNGDFRSLGYMRPLSVWAIQWEIDRNKRR